MHERVVFAAHNSEVPMNLGQQIGRTDLRTGRGARAQAGDWTNGEVIIGKR
jgi:hypothetical protein